MKKNTIGLSYISYCFHNLAVLCIAVCLYTLNCKAPNTLAEKLGYLKNDILVIVHTDDVGLHRQVTEASLDASISNIVKSGSVMVPCPDFMHTLEIWKQNPSLDLGIHLTLTCEYGRKYPWSPVLPKSKVPSLYNPDGIMWPSVNDLVKNGTIHEITIEMEAQINKVIDEGLKPSHLDGHMDFYFRNKHYFKAVMDLSRKYKIPVRVWGLRKYRFPIYPYNLPYLHKRGYIFPDSYKGFYFVKGEEMDSKARLNTYIEYLNGLKPGVHQIITHFTFKTEDVSNAIEVQNATRRFNDYKAWTDPKIKEIADKRNIIFIDYRPLQRLQEIKWDEK